MILSVLANIDVDSLLRATDFYCRALGLRVGRRFGSSAVELLGGSTAIYLLEKPSGTPASAESPVLRDYTRHWTPVHLDFVVPEIQSAVVQARNAGARVRASRVKYAPTIGAALLSWPIHSGTGSV